MPLEVKIEYAKKLAKDLGYSEVIIYAYDKETDIESVTTYGVTKEDCEDAAEIGNDIKRLMGWPKEFCNTKPERTDFDNE